MREKKYDLCVYIGRFAPLHKGHISVINQAFEYADDVLILAGSAFAPRNIKNPFTYEERKNNIEKHILPTLGEYEDLHIRPVKDSLYNDNLWISEIGKFVHEVKKENQLKSVALIGFEKDLSSQYLNFFGHWDRIEATPYPNENEIISASDIRNCMFEGKLEFLKSVLPEDDNGRNAAIDFIESEEFLDLKDEWEYVKAYKKSWAGSPFPPTFLTTDAIVTQSGQVLVIERKDNPGRGLWAIPGGFLEQGETMEDSMIRELVEETNLRVPEKVLRGSVKDEKIFDHPNRSERGRVVTNAFHVKLDDNADLPRVSGGTDAKKAFWIPISQALQNPHRFFEDHHAILTYFLSKG